MSGEPQDNGSSAGRPGAIRPNTPPKTTVDLDDDQSIESSVDDLEVRETDEDLAEDADVVGGDHPPPSGGKP